MFEDHLSTKIEPLENFPLYGIFQVHLYVHVHVLGCSYSDGIYHNICSIQCLQVAFGSDFSQPWSDEALGLKNIKGDGGLGFLIDHAFRGVQIGYRNPLHFVSAGIELRLVINLHSNRPHLSSDYTSWSPTSTCIP